MKDYLTHLVCVLILTLISVTYFYPVLSNKSIQQSDISQFSGMSKQIVDHRENFNEEPYWLDNAFLGMPSYQVSAKYPFDLLYYIDQAIRFLPRPADYLFLYLLSFYFLIISLNINYRYALFGAIAFGFSTYLIIILGVGHNTKALAIGYLPFIIMGLLMIFKKDFLKGFLITSLALGLQIHSNHYQMTYYMLILLGIYFIVYLVDSYRKNDVKDFITYMSLFVLAGILSLGLNAPNILSTYDYSKYSTRSQSELKLNPDGTEKEISTGLDYDYITQYSYGIFESLNLIAPRVQGGASSEDVGKDSDLYEFLIDNNVPKPQAESFIKSVPTYWGSQPILEAPAYIGASIAFLL